ncbi:hypothetical protein ABZ807_04855 [Micromonospora sp. NPDC047548]
MSDARHRWPAGDDVVLPPWWMLLVDSGRTADGADRRANANTTMPRGD